MQDAAIGEVTECIRKGDCTCILETLAAGTIDLVFADPPFNIGYDYDVYDDRKEREEYLAWSKNWIGAVHRVLKPTGTFWLAIGDEYAAELKIQSRDIGFQCRSWVIWYYTFGVNCTRKFSRSHAHLFHLVKDERQFTFRENALENRVPSARQLVYADRRANPRGRLPDDTWVLRPQDLADCFTPAEDTWYFPRVAGTFKERAGFHGCQMPEQLLGRIIRTCTNDGDIVLDPFAGSATTLVVAKKLGRRYIGIEISQEYVRRGIERLRGVRLGDSLEGSAEPVASAPQTPRADSLPQTQAGAAAAERLGHAVTQLNGGILATTQRGLLEAFRQVHAGFSLDRVVADPDLNAKLADACRALALAGDIRSWNRLLFRMRKAGKLADIPTRERTALSWADCDDFLFASEIALKQLLDKGCESVDEILCDPSLAQEFDQMAWSLAPGFSSLQYRWAALKLRKEAKVARTRAEVLTPLRLGNPIALEELDFKQIPEAAGVYLITGVDGEPKVYGGEALDLRRRFHGQFGPQLLDHWKSTWSADLVAYAVSSELNVTELLAYQSFLIREHRPALNCLEFAT